MIQSQECPDLFQEFGSTSVTQNTANDDVPCEAMQYQQQSEKVR